MLRTANPRRADAHGTFESDVADGAFAFVDYGDGLVARVSGDIDHGRAVDDDRGARRDAQRGRERPDVDELSVFVLGEDEQDELEIAPSPYEKHGQVHGNLPFFLPLLDAFARAVDLGAPGVPTFADGLVAQRSLEAIG